MSPPPFSCLHQMVEVIFNSSLSFDLKLPPTSHPQTHNLETHFANSKTHPESTFSSRVSHCPRPGHRLSLGPAMELSLSPCFHSALPTPHSPFIPHSVTRVNWNQAVLWTHVKDLLLPHGIKSKLIFLGSKGTYNLVPLFPSKPAPTIPAFPQPHWPFCASYLQTSSQHWALVQAGLCSLHSSFRSEHGVTASASSRFLPSPHIIPTLTLCTPLTSEGSPFDWLVYHL